MYIYSCCYTMMSIDQLFSQLWLQQSFFFFFIILEQSPVNSKQMLLISMHLHLIISLTFSVASQQLWLVDSCKMYTQDGLASSLLLFIISFNIHLNIIRESEFVGKTSSNNIPVIYKHISVLPGQRIKEQAKMQSDCMLVYWQQKINLKFSIKLS